MGSVALRRRSLSRAYFQNWRQAGHKSNSHITACLGLNLTAPHPQ